MVISVILVVGGAFMLTREIAMYLLELEEAVNAVREKYQPEGVVADVKVKQHGNDLAELLEEGWQLL